MSTLRLRLSTILVLSTALALVSACRDRNGDDDAGPADGGIRLDAGPCTPSGDEDTPAACADNVDNDCSGFRDCNDFSCCGIVTCGLETACGGRDAGPACEPTGAEDTMAACTDGVDNDCDRFTDCGSPGSPDFDCSAFCPAENSNRACSNGTDDDDNGFTDCEDNECMERIVCAGEVTNAACSDGVDNDMADGMDCADPDCQAEAIVVCDGTVPAASEWPALVETACTNGTDDGGRAEVDCADFSCLWNHPDCVQPGRENTNGLCDDGMDNDLDGDTDCDDPSCDDEGIVVCDSAGPAPDPTEWAGLTNTECSNGTNEDAAAEGTSPRVDCADFGCSQSPDATTACADTEGNDTTCGDGMDNDDNGFTDCDDLDCVLSATVTVCPANAAENTFEECSNGIDDNGNGFIDCDDLSCNPDSGATPSPACW